MCVCVIPSCCADCRKPLHSTSGRSQPVQSLVTASGERGIQAFIAALQCLRQAVHGICNCTGHVHSLVKEMPVHMLRRLPHLQTNTTVQPTSGQTNSRKATAITTILSSCFVSPECSVASAAKFSFFTGSGLLE
jgi:hypothetical protein